MYSQMHPISFYLLLSVNVLDLNEFSTVLLNIFARSRKQHFLIEFYSEKIVRFIFNECRVEKLTNNDEFSETDDDENEEKMRFLDNLCNESANISLLEYNLLLSQYQKTFSDASYYMDAIGIRLLKTFDYDEQVDEEFHKNILRKLVTESSVTEVRAYLNLSIADDGNVIRPTKFTSNAISYKYDLEQTLLCIAASKDLEIVKLLLRLGADVHAEDKDKKTASDYTYSNLENLKFLLENDARFPRQKVNSFELRVDNGIKKDIQILCEERCEFHSAIEAGDIEKIKSFRKKFPCLKYAYKLIENYPRSRAATTTAFLKASFSTYPDVDYTTYFSLLDEGFRPNDFEIDEVQPQKGMKSKINLLWLSRLRREQSNAHVTRFLLSMTKIAYVSVEEHETYFEKIKNIYETLNEIEEVKGLLRILEYSKSLIINFDFFNKSVITMDLTADISYDGNTYHNLGRIYVSTAQKSDKEIAGVLIHELTHFALHIVFGNACKPYYKSDEISERKFGTIVNSIKRLDTDNHPEMKKVYECYLSKNFAKELIARVPQLIVLGDKDVLLTKYKELFDFFVDNILPKVNELTQNAEEFLIKREVEQLNEVLGHVEQIEKWNIWPNDSIIPLKTKAKLFVCKTPRLFLSDFFKFIIRPSLISSPQAGVTKVNFIVASFEDLNSQSKTEWIQRIWNLTPDITLILNCENFTETLLKKCKFLNNNNILGNFLLFGCQESILRRILTTKQIESFTLEYKWENIDRSSRDKLLLNEISFQGCDVQLKSLIGVKFANIPMVKLVSGERIVINVSKVVIDNYDPDMFVSRCFKVYGNVDQLLVSTKNRLVTLFLSGDAGTGKSIILSHIALRLKVYNPESWILRINLHEQGDALDNKTVVDPFEFVSKFFVQIDADNEFQQELFKKLYDDGHVIILLDGLDEIVPKFYDKVNWLIENLNEKIQLWITTRPHLKNDLENKFAKGIFLRFDTFSKKEHIMCATKYWQKQLKIYHIFDEMKLMNCADKIILRFYDSLHVARWDSVIGAPLLTTMVAEIYLKDAEQYVKNDIEAYESTKFIDIFQLFKEFTSKKIQIANNERGIYIARERAENEIFNDHTMPFLEHKALQLILQPHDDDFSDKTYTINKHHVQRCGFVSFFSNGELYFIHRTFAEFFVANSIVKTLWKVSYSIRDRERNFNDSMRMLCETIIYVFGNENEPNLTLLRFIDQGMKYLWNEQNQNGNFNSGARFLNQNAQMIDYHNLNSLMHKDAIFLAYYFVKCLLFNANNGSDEEPVCKKIKYTIETKLFDEPCNIFWKASETCVRCIVECLCQLINENQKELGHYLLVERHDFTPFQFAFMKFPKSELDIVKDTTDFIQLRDALLRTDRFDEIVRKPIEEKYKNSTLKLHVDIVNKLYPGKQIDFIKYVPYMVDTTDVSYKYFVDSMEMKWMAMEDLNIFSTDFLYLEKHTMFQNIFHIIFKKFWTRIILEFYVWAKVKAHNNPTFKCFVEETFVKYFWNCPTELGVSKILDFIRNEINVKDVLQRRLPEILTIICSVDEDIRYQKIFFIFEFFFTTEECEILMFHKEPSGDNLASKFLKSLPKAIFYVEPFLLLISKCSKEILNEMKEFFVINNVPTMNFWIPNIIRNINSHSYKPTSKHITNTIFAIFPNELLKKAIHCPTIFHLASQRRDMLIMQMLWHMAKKCLTSDQLDVLLCTPDNDGHCIIKNAASKQFLDEPPNLWNTYCASAAFEFIPYTLEDGIPENAVSVDPENSIYIGLVGSELCQIMIEQMRVDTIGRNMNCNDKHHDYASTCRRELPKNRPNDKFEIMVGKGLYWKLLDSNEYLDEADKHYFIFDNYFLSKYEQNSLSLVPVLSMGDYYLTYDDSSVDSSTDFERDFIYYKK